MKMIIGIVLLSACAVEEPQTGSIESHATAYLLAGKYYYRTDVFAEQCGAGSLAVFIGGNPLWANVPRGDVTYLKPATFTGGEFAWRCGSQAANGIDWSECDESPADWVRFYWDPNSRNINVQCFRKCGDGSSAVDCVPY
jgi:hypothetical protein